MKAAFKHLQGQHDQQTHDPTKGVGKVVGAIPKHFKPGQAPPTPEGAAEWLATISQESDPRADAFLNDFVEYPMAGPPDWRYASNGNRGRVKAAIVTKLAEESGVDEKTVNEIIGGWATTSNDTDAGAMALQAQAAELFGVELSPWQSNKWYTWKANIEYDAKNWQALVEEKRKFLKDNPPYGLEDLAKLRGMTVDQWFDDEANNFAEQEWQYKYKDALKPDVIRTYVHGKAVLQAMYENTQARLQAKFKPNDTIRLYRGLKTGPDAGLKNGQAYEYNGNAIESWSSDYYVAQSFGDFVVTMDIPIKNIVSTAGTGLGCLREGEFVVLGNLRGQKARVTGKKGLRAVYQEPVYVAPEPFNPGGIAEGVYELKHLFGHHDQQSHDPTKGAGKQAVIKAMQTASWKDRPDVDYRPGISLSYIVELEGDGLAIVKPTNGPDRNFYAEADTYAVAQEMGWNDLVPVSANLVSPKVAVGDNYGSVQQWVDGAQTFYDFDTHIQYGRDIPGKATSVDWESFENLGLLDTIIGNGDRHEGNLLIKNKNGKAQAVAIDHNLAWVANARLTGMREAVSYFKRVHMNVMGTHATRPKISWAKFKKIKKWINDDNNPLVESLRQHHGSDFISSARGRVDNLEDEAKKGQYFDFDYDN